MISTRNAIAVVSSLMMWSSALWALSEDRVRTSKVEECARKLANENPSISMEKARKHCASDIAQFPSGITRTPTNSCSGSALCNPGVGKVDGLADAANDKRIFQGTNSLQLKETTSTP